MASDPGGPPPLAINTVLAGEHLPGSSVDNMEQNPVDSVASATGTPLSPAPPTPGFTQSVRDSQPGTSPRPQHAYPPPNLRRTSSTSSVRQRPPSSPRLESKTSRTSLRANSEDASNGLSTPKRSISNLIAGLREAHSGMEVIDEPVVLTALQIAQAHFARELGAHGQAESQAETMVIVHDACYGHRYSRLKTTKSLLSMIVERPERLLASVLGISAAYVRLGEHHAGGKNAPHPDRLAAGQAPFTIRRTERTMDILAPYVTAVHGTAWMAELQSMAESAGSKIAAGEKELTRISTPSEPEKPKLHEGDLYLCGETLNAFQGALGGVADAVDAVFSPTSETKHAFVAIRPPGHHCSADHPSGFCWLNNVHVGIEYAAQVYGLTHAAILDFDLHHGDGSQTIAWAHNSKNNIKRLNAKPNSKLKLGPDIGYYSIHDINSYPCETGDDEKVQAASLCVEDAHGQSIWNVHLQPWKTEAEFWQLYESRYAVLFEKTRAFLERHTTRLRLEGKVRPKAAIFISAGFDASEHEGQGMQRHKVNVPTEFYARFTRDVVKIAHESNLGCDGKVISVLEGGYSDRALCSGVLSHLSGFCTTPAKSEGRPNPMALDQMMDGLAINKAPISSAYDKTWWSAENLAALETRVNPPPPPAPGKKGRAGAQPTYATPTESFAYKVVDTDKFARSISGTMREAPKPTCAPTPPPPEVDWVTSTHELSKLLIPSERQTKSCTAEELSGVRTKKDPQNTVPAITPIDSSKPRQLRDRKVKSPERAIANSDELAGVSAVNRRQTIGDLPVVAQQEAPPPPRRMSRRLSAGSAFGSMNGDIDPEAPPVPPIPTAKIPSSPRKTGASAAASSAPGLPVKKTRVAPKLTTTVPTSSSPSSPSAAKRPLTATGFSRSTAASANKDVAASTNKDIDALSSGMKKITLKVGTREEHDRKQKEKVDADRRARALKAAETRKLNAAAKKAAATETAGPSDPPAGVEVAEAPIVAAQQVSPQTGSVSDIQPEVRDVRDDVQMGDTMSLGSEGRVVRSSSLSGIPPGINTSRPSGTQPEQPTLRSVPSIIPPNPGTVKPEPAMLHQSDLLPTLPNFSQPRPSGLSSGLPSYRPQSSNGPTRALQHQPLNAHANTSPIRPRSRDQLPVWSSTSAIPFAAVNGEAKLPAYARPGFQHAAAAGAVPAATLDGGAYPVSEMEGRREDVWDVPVTPEQQQK